MPSYRGIVATITVLLVTFVSVGVAAYASTVSVVASHLDPGETLLLGALGHAFGIDTDVALKYRSDLGTTEGAVTLSYTAQSTGISADQILRERRSGKRWEDITRSTLPPGLRNKPPSHPGRANHEAKRGMDPYELDTTIQFIAEYYGVDIDWVQGWIDVDISLEDMALALNLSARVGINPDDVLRLRHNSREWEWRWMASRYGISVALLAEPVPPKGFTKAETRASLVMRRH